MDVITTLISPKDIHIFHTHIMTSHIHQIPHTSSHHLLQTYRDTIDQYNITQKEEEIRP